MPLSGLQLIEASAGTGKTHTITDLFLRLILEKALTIDQILVVTYTEAATGELRDRIRKRLRDEKIRLGLETPCPEIRQKSSLLQHALIHFDEAAIFTIHGFCFHLLKEQAYESGSLFDTELITSQDRLLQETVTDFWRKTFYDNSAIFTAYALASNCTPEHFQALVSRHLQNPMLNIIPDFSPPDTGPLEKAFSKTYARTAAAWQQDCREIENLLITSAGLKRNIYKKESIPKWMSEFSSFFSHPEPSVILPEKLVKLTPAELLKGTKKGETPPDHPFFELCEPLVAEAGALISGFNQKLVCLKKELFGYTRQSLSQKKEHHHVLYFDDLLLKVHQVLRGPNRDFFTAAVRSRFRAVLIDEFQDTDPVQYEIFSRLFVHRDTALFLIGDPKQAIYSFRNADLFAYLKAAAAADRPLPLDINWRADPGLIQAVNQLFSAHRNPFLYPGVNFIPVQPAPERKDVFTRENRTAPMLHLWFFETGKEAGAEALISKPETSQEISDAVAAEISTLLALARSGQACIEDRPVHPGDMAVLVRKHKQARLVQESLRQLSIPAILHSTGSVFETEEAVQLIHILEAAASPGDERRLKAALSTDLLGISGENLLATEENAVFLETEMIAFQRYHALWLSSGFYQMFQQLLIDRNIRRRLIRLEDGERRLTNILHLAELIHHQLTHETLGMAATVKWVSDQIQTPGHDQDEEQLRLETDRDAVKIITIHKSKGLEYPIVFCPFLWEGPSQKPKNNTALFHDREKALSLDLGSEQIDEHMDIAAAETLAEDMRLLYVALTRAKHCCYLVWGGFKDAAGSSLAYLFHNQNCTAPETAVPATKAIFKSLSDRDIFNTLKACQDSSNGFIRVTPLTADRESAAFVPSAAKPPDLSCPVFNQQIIRKIRFTSFSSLVSGSSHESEWPEADEFFHETDDAPLTADLSIFNFPAGAVPGTMLHEILEHLDFSADDDIEREKLVRDNIRRYGFEEKWIPVIGTMLKDLVAAPLDPEDQAFCLSQIKHSDRLNELEFYFPVKNMSRERLSSLFAEAAPVPPARNFNKELDRLAFSPVNGFLKGFIDLVFKYQNKFYIVDWKSNLVGKDISAYQQEQLLSIMHKDYYMLQYHLYTLALHKYLKNRLPDYDYEKDFGGIFYIFLRGIGRTQGPGCGIYRDRPKKKFILEMERALGG